MNVIRETNLCSMAFIDTGGQVLVNQPQHIITTLLRVSEALIQ
jgi:hypothetical protein